MPKVDKRKVREILTRINADIRELHAMFELDPYELATEEPKTRAARKPKDPDLQERKRAFIAWFYDLRKAKLQGLPAKDHPRDPAKVEALLKTYGEERLQKIAQALMLTNDEWVSGTARDISVLSAKAEWLDLKLREHGL